MKEKEIIDQIVGNLNMNACLKYLYKEYYGMLERLVVINGGTKQDGEDVVQETMVSFIQIVQSGKYREEANIKSFLYAVAKNVWFTKLKKQKSEDTRAGIWIEGKDEIEEDIQTHLKKKEALGLIVSVIDGLGEVCSNILKRFYYEDLSLKEILPHTNFENEQVLRNKKSKCMKSLMDRLETNPKLKEGLNEALKLL